MEFWSPDRLLKYTFRFQLNVLSIEFASMTLFILCILTELFLYCYYGNELTVEVSAAVTLLQLVYVDHLVKRPMGAYQVRL